MERKKQNFGEMCYWNNNSYGSAVRISKFKLKAINLFLAVIVPIVYPVPLAVFLNRFIKKGITIRYEVK